MNINKKVLYCLTGILCIFLAALYIISVKRSVEQRKKEEWRIGGIQSRCYASAVSEDGNAVYVIGGIPDNDMMSSITWIVPNIYAVALDYQYVMTQFPEDFLNVHFTRNLQKLVVRLYDLKTGKKIRSFDIKQMFDEKGWDVQVTQEDWIDTCSYQNCPYLILSIEDVPHSVEESQKDTTRRIYINLETGALLEKGKEEDNSWKLLMDKKTKLFNDDEHHFLWHNIAQRKEDNPYVGGVYTSYYWQNCIEIVIYDINTLPKNNQKLYSMFQDLKEQAEKLTKAERRVWLYIILSNNPSNQEIMELLMEDGQEVSFDGVVLRAEDSIDGKEHEIHSFEEWDKYVITSEGHPEYTQPVFKSRPGED